jgi:hypothetical protein
MTNDKAIVGWGFTPRRGRRHMKCRPTDLRDESGNHGLAIRFPT